MPEIDCFATVGGAGLYGLGATWLAHSILRHHPETDIYVGVPTTEKQSTPLPADAEPVEIEPPIPEYMVSVQAATLRWVEQNTAAKTIVTVDPDAILVDELQLSSVDADLYAKPADLIFHRDLSKKQYWQRVADALDKELPSERFKVTVTGRENWPYYQTGVYVTNDTDIAEDLIDYIRRVYEATGGDYFCEQIAFSMLALEYECHHLDERHNFPLNLRLWPRKDAQVLHYKEPQQLLRCWRFYNHVESCGAADYLSDEYPGLSRYRQQLVNVRNILFHRTRWRLLGGYGWDQFN